MFSSSSNPIPSRALLFAAVLSLLLMCCLDGQGGGLPLLRSALADGGGRSGLCSTEEDCAFGHIPSGQGQSAYCKCACDEGSGFSPPHCFYKVSEAQPVTMVLNISAAEAFSAGGGFNSDYLVHLLCNASGIADGDTAACGAAMTMQRIEVVSGGASFSQTSIDEVLSCTVLVRSPFVVPLLDGAHQSAVMADPSTNPNAWVRAVGLIAIQVAVPLPSNDRGDGMLMALVLGTLYRQDVTLGSFIWVIASLIIIIVMLTTDGLFFGHKGGLQTSKEKALEESMRRERRSSLLMGITATGGAGGGPHARGKVIANGNGDEEMGALLGSPLSAAKEGHRHGGDPSPMPPSSSPSPRVVERAADEGEAVPLAGLALGDGNYPPPKEAAPLPHPTVASRTHNISGSNEDYAHGAAMGSDVHHPNALTAEADEEDGAVAAPTETAPLLPPLPAPFGEEGALATDTAGDGQDVEDDTTHGAPSGEGKKEKKHRKKKKDSQHDADRDEGHCSGQDGGGMEGDQPCESLVASEFAVDHADLDV